MKIAVCIKAVPDTATGRRIDPATLRLDRSGDLALSDYDAHAVEEALALRDSGLADEVVLVSVGPANANDALRKALAMGADRALLVSDETLAGADLLVTSKALANVLAKEASDLVLFGQQSADGEGACLWAAVADRLELPIISQVSELTVEGGIASGRRQTEFGYETIRAPLPAVVAVSDAINEPRYPSLKGIMGAKSKPQEILAATEPGSSGTSVLGLGAAPARGGSRRIEDAGSAAETIVEFLVERRLL